jgi:hypothetical protein
MRMPPIPPSALSEEQRPLHADMREGIEQNFRGFAAMRESIRRASPRFDPARAGTLIAGPNTREMCSVLLFGLFLRPLLLVLRVPRGVLKPIIFLRCTIGACANAKRVFDVYVMMWLASVHFSQAWLLNGTVCSRSRT